MWLQRWDMAYRRSCLKINFFVSCGYYSTLKERKQRNSKPFTWKFSYNLVMSSPEKYKRDEDVSTCRFWVLGKLISIVWYSKCVINLNRSERSGHQNVAFQCYQVLFFCIIMQRNQQLVLGPWGKG